MSVHLSLSVDSDIVVWDSEWKVDRRARQRGSAQERRMHGLWMEAVCGHVNAWSVREVSYASFAGPQGCVHSRVTYTERVSTVLRGRYHNMGLALPSSDRSRGTR